MPKKKKKTRKKHEKNEKKKKKKKKERIKKKKKKKGMGVGEEEPIKKKKEKKEKKNTVSEILSENVIVFPFSSVLKQASEYEYPLKFAVADTRVNGSSWNALTITLALRICF